MPCDIATFLSWCTKHGIEIDSRLEICVSRDGSLAVFTRQGAQIAPKESLVGIPKSIVFSAKNCSLSRDLFTSESEPSLTLALAFLTETSIGSASPWYEYFISLPTCTVDIPVFWEINGDQDGIQASAWIQGTELGNILFPLGQLTLLERINEYFKNVAQPQLQRLQLSYGLEDFYRAYSIVSSRAFIVDAYLGLSLVPVADAFNHIEDNHVHLQSDYHVCSACGSLDECDHDFEDADSSVISYTTGDSCEMVANSPIGPYEEVYNTYGDMLGNAQLLCQYGFMLDGNENSIITWTTKQLLDGTAKPEGTFNLWRELTSRPNRCDWDNSQLVYNIETSVTDDDGLPIQNRNAQLQLNADGQISHQLWLLFFAIVLSDVDVGINDAMSIAGRVAKTQERLETRLTARDSAYDTGPSSNSSGCLTPVTAIFFVQKIAEYIVLICGQKIKSAHCAEVSALGLGDILDEMPDEQKLTRLAISYTLEERTVLQSCQSVWTEMADLCRSEADGY